MSHPPQYPEVPYPLPPEQEPPQRTEPVVVPVVDVDRGEVGDQLAEQRKVLITGPLDHRTSADIVAQLMAFDGSSRRDVEIVIASPGGSVADILPVLDVLALMRAKVNVTALGAVSGTAVAVVAVCSGERRAAAHATFSLRVDATESIEGTADDIARQADELSRLQAHYLATLAAATGQPSPGLADEIAHGGPHSADEAITMGIVDSIAGRA